MKNSLLVWLNYFQNISFDRMQIFNYFTRLNVQNGARKHNGDYLELNQNNQEVGSAQNLVVNLIFNSTIVVN